jgi:hyaluronan synthase
MTEDAPLPFSTLIVFYTILCTGHLALQFLFAHLHHWREVRAARHRQTSMDRLLQECRFPSVTVIYPIYNETPEILRRVLQCAKECLRIPGLDLIFVDDGSPNREELRPVYEAFQGERIQVVYKKNGGKRDAQYVGFGLARGEFIVTVDSDTLINPEGVLTLVAPMVENPDVGAVCGDVRVENASHNLLTRLISIRYWTAFNLERAAQSFFGAILCCSGPFSAYRGSLVQTIKERYVQQTFFGRKCTYGDDRHLTNLVLHEGYQTVYQEGAIAHTYVPETMREYIVQQNRWNKSFFRELLWTPRDFSKVHPYCLFDAFFQPLVFVVFTFVIGHNIYLFAESQDLKIPTYYLGMLVLMASVRTLYGLVRTWNPEFLVFILYGFLHILVLTPVRFKSLLTLDDNAWGTRSQGKSNVLGDFCKWSCGYWGMALLVALALYIWQTGLAPFNRDGRQLIYSGSAEDFILSIAGTWNYAATFLIAMLSAFIGSSLLFPRRAVVQIHVEHPSSSRELGNRQ